MISKITPTIESTDDGSQSLIHPLIGELYHSSRGAVGESLHIYINNGFLTIDKDVVNIVEVGFGSGLNCYLTLLESIKTNRKVNYTTIELYPIDMQTVELLEYSKDPLFVALHTSEWNRWVDVAPNFRIKKLGCDLQTIANFDESIDLVYYDAFAPDSQPELWNILIFDRIFKAMSSGGVLVTYTAKGIVKQALREVGFIVKRLPGALGKLHMLRAQKP